MWKALRSTMEPHDSACTETRETPSVHKMSGCDRYSSMAMTVTACMWKALRSAMGPHDSTCIGTAETPSVLTPLIATGTQA